MRAKKIRTIVLTTAAIVAACLIVISNARAQQAMQPAPTMTAPAMTAPNTPPKPAPAAMPAPMPPEKLSAPAGAPSLATMAQPTPAAMKPVTGAMTGSPAMTAAPVKNETAKKPMSADELVSLIFKILVGLATLVFTILGGLGYMKWTKSERFKQIQKYVDMAFPAVEALVKKTDTTVDDKLVEFLKMVNGLLKKHGQPELNDAETAAAKELAAKKALAEKLSGKAKR